MDFGPQLFPETFEKIRRQVPSDLPVYLVGGAVRDSLLGRPIHDLDFLVFGDVPALARRVANSLDSALYSLDESRETLRVIWIRPDGVRELIDFAAPRGPDLESDLRARDFSINAMAVDLRALTQLIDPLQGLKDLTAGKIRACSPTTFLDDPLRVVRAVRQAVDFGYQIVPQTIRLMRQAVPAIQRVSAERLRDELFRILDVSQPGSALRILETIGALPNLLPELTRLKGIQQPPPHTLDVWEHTLSVVADLNRILSVLGTPYDPDAATNLVLGQVSLRLGRFRNDIQEHLNRRITPDRSARQLLFLAALLHDAGKAQTQQVDEIGRIRFLGHDQAGAVMAARRCRELRLSNEEIEFVKVVVGNHMRPLLLAGSGSSPTARAIYRFFRDTGPAGVDVCLLSMADSMGTYGVSIPQDAWGQHLEVIRAMFEAFWEAPERKISPPLLVSGYDIMQAFNLPPGPQIGQLLEAVREAQVDGLVSDRDGALEYARQQLDKLN